METKSDSYSLLMVQDVWTNTNCFIKYICLLNIARKKSQRCVFFVISFSLDGPLSRQLVSSCSLESMPFLRSSARSGHQDLRVRLRPGRVAPWLLL